MRNHHGQRGVVVVGCSAQVAAPRFAIPGETSLSTLLLAVDDRPAATEAVCDAVGGRLRPQAGAQAKTSGSDNAIPGSRLLYRRTKVRWWLNIARPEEFYTTRHNGGQGKSPG